MTRGSFHDPRTGSSFSAKVKSGSYTVISPSGDSITVTTVVGQPTSQCVCPICSKSFDVDLLEDISDFFYGACLSTKENSQYLVMV